MTTTADQPDLLDSLPAAESIRERMAAIRAESRLLRDLLSLAERRERQRPQQYEGDANE